MKLLGPTRHARLNEAVAVVYLFAGAALMLSLISYRPDDPSLNTAAGDARPVNLLGFAGSYLSDALLQTIGLTAFVLPGMVLLLAWNWLHSREVESPAVKLFGSGFFILCLSTTLSLSTGLQVFSGRIPAGGVIGMLAADALVGALNFTGAAMAIATSLVISLYLISTFSIALLRRWLSAPLALFRRLKLPSWRWPRFPKFGGRREAETEVMPPPVRRRAIRVDETPAILKRSVTAPADPEPPVADTLPPWETSEPAAPRGEFHDEPETETPVDPHDEEEIPILSLEEQPPSREELPPPPPLAPRTRAEQKRRSAWSLPPTTLLNQAEERTSFDAAELKETAARIKSKFEEFSVLGNVTQINPGPVVTTFEFKPEAGIKYSKIVTLTEDLCLGLQAESILIERIPGKPTVGIEVPNSRREVISLRQILESDEFAQAGSRLVLPLGKDVSGRIKVSALETMPHLLVAGSTGSGKSVMLNSMIMSILYKSTPEEVRMIMIDPKRVELGIYEGIPHLLTPVITDPRKATNALRNAVLEMERRLKLLASHHVRNIDQFNKKVRQLVNEPRSLFEETEDAPGEELKPLPYILILIDELADLMMLERNNVEESVARLAQMARAVGMHLVLATQRPSVDVITGLIKANFPARISFRVATRVDSRTILDVMGAEHLLGKGDMLVLPPGSSRLVRMHGAFVTEAEISGVVDYWKSQALPEYDQSFLIAPANEDGTETAVEGEDDSDGADDPVYADAVRVVVELGKASTSTLQRRLRLGYGRAARILDRMHKEGIIGPPDGSRPREVLRAPDWLQAGVS
jgi:S-DNA-T family DNA segregation ATPase FtsK/SpoIIIE